MSYENETTYREAFIAGMLHPEALPHLIYPNRHDLRTALREGQEEARNAA